MMRNISILLYVLLFGLSLSQNAELVTQKIKLENAIREKVSTTVNKFLDPSQYIIVVNARLDFKPLSFNSSGNFDKGAQDYEYSSYTFIPGLDMPSIPTDQTIYKQSSQSGLAGFKYSSSLLYGMEIIIYLDESVATGSLQQNIKTLIQNNIPEIIDCSDCIKFESLDLLSSAGIQSTSISDKISQLEQERRDAELELQNWRFSQLEQQLAIAEEARGEWETQARDREEQRRIEDANRMAKLEKIEKIHRAKQDSLHVLSSIKLDEAIRGRIESEVNTKQELLNLIKLQIRGESLNGVDENGIGLMGKKPLPARNSFTSQTWLMILTIFILLSILLILLMKNRTPVYLKPKNSEGNGVKDNDSISSSDEHKEINLEPTQAHTTDEVVKSELQSLRQSAVSMSVSEKTGANQIVKDWLDDSTESKEDNSEE